MYALALIAVKIDIIEGSLQVNPFNIQKHIQLYSANVGSSALVGSPLRFVESRI